MFSLLHLTLAMVNGTGLIPSTTAKLLSRSANDWMSGLRFEIEQLSRCAKDPFGERTRFQDRAEGTA
ncbi:MAG TPA: hypothetical protein VLK88_10495 [Gemmatimonadales bacterium]|nr:hypothetical protein [Gemmatimonadales bacterium]